MFALFCKKANPQPIEGGVIALSLQMQPEALLFQMEAVIFCASRTGEVKNLLLTVFFCSGKLQSIAFGNSVRDIKITAKHMDGFPTFSKKESGRSTRMMKQQSAVAVELYSIGSGKMKFKHERLRKVLLKKI